MSKFKLGEIAVLQNCDCFPSLNGEECTIIEEEDWHFIERDELGFDSFLAYLISCRAGKFLAPEHCLRKKKPPESGEQSIISLFLKTTKKEPEFV